MQTEIRSDGTMKISGYVNTTGRESRVLTDVTGKFVEIIVPGAFKRALENNKAIKMLLNHDYNRILASQEDGTLKLYEDSIGLRAEAVISDSEVIAKAKQHKLSGWSFGMYVTDETIETGADGISKRSVKALDIDEVSIIDDRMSPCYTATSIETETRGDAEIMRERRARADECILDNNEDPLKAYKERFEKIGK